MSSFTYLITGASRGLGYAYTEALLASSPAIKIVATARNPGKATELNALAAKNEGRLLVVKLDVDSEESVKALASELESHPFTKDGIDSLINNAGICPGSWNTTLQSDTAELDATLRTNLYGPYWVTRALLPLLRKGTGKQVVMMSTIAGSFGSFGADLPGVATYAISKVALNMLTVKLARELASEDFIIVSYHPGWVKTDINVGGQGDIEVEEAVEAAFKHLFPKLTKENTAKFLSFDGSSMPW
ncbi:hypothetical protein JCM6882_006666 [Rhodosporidiobolus microsporus]